MLPEKNGPTWKARLELAVEARGLEGYLHGKKLKPKDPREGKSPGWTPTTAAEIKEVDDYETASEKWHEKNALVKQQIAVTIPNSLFLQIKSKPTAHKYYEALKTHFEDRLLVISVELRCQLGEMKLKEGGDARAHLEKMASIREDLASMGKPVSDTNSSIYSSPRYPTATTPS